MGIGQQPRSGPAPEKPRSGVALELRSSKTLVFAVDRELASITVVDCVFTVVSTVSPLYASCSATQYTVNSILTKDESFDTNRSLDYVILKHSLEGLF